MRRVLIIGCGDVMQRALPWLTRRYRVFATVRDREQAGALRALGVTPVVADLDRPPGLARLAGLGEMLIHSAPPAASGERDLRTRRLVAAISKGRMLPRALVYISTTGVYGDCGGNRVDETRPVRPRSARALRRADAEKVLRAFGRRSGARIALLRAPGIYAEDRLPVDRLRRGDPVLAAEEDVYTNHIHAADLGRAACLALTRARPGRAYNICDDSRLRMGEYFDLVADVLGLPRPPRVSRAEARRRLSPVSLSFMEESRRLCNRRMKRELRVRLFHPTVAGTLAHLRADTPCSG